MSDLRLYNTLTRQVEPFTPSTPGEAKLYVCGPTVYDVAHAGNARPPVVFDVLARHLRARGLRVTYVRNITDVDDKIVDRARDNGEHPPGWRRSSRPTCARSAASIRRTSRR